MLFTTTGQKFLENLKLVPVQRCQNLLTSSVFRPSTANISLNDCMNYHLKALNKTCQCFRTVYWYSDKDFDLCLFPICYSGLSTVGSKLEQAMRSQLTLNTLCEGAVKLVPATQEVVPHLLQVLFLLRQTLIAYLNICPI